MIKNLQYLNTTPEVREELTEAAVTFKENENITFTIIAANKDLIILQINQHANTTKSYLTGKELRNIAKELFEPFFPNHIIRYGAIPYFEPKTSIVTPEWISSNLYRRSISIKGIEKTTGIERKQLKAWINGENPMGASVKAMFYFMLNENHSK